jgi:UDP-2-acetamido-2,6-beta-L-arabino-hexul-4-ose reductase
LRVGGEHPVAVDMPTMWAHRLTNIGSRPAITFFWTNEVYAADDPDTFACPVESADRIDPDAMNERSEAMT